MPTDQPSNADTIGTDARDDASTVAVLRDADLDDPPAAGGSPKAPIDPVVTGPQPTSPVPPSNAKRNGAGFTTARSSRTPTRAELRLQLMTDESLQVVVCGLCDSPYFLAICAVDPTPKL